MGSLPGLRWWRTWPPELGPAGSPTASSVVTIKSIAAPLRVGSVVATRDRTQLKVFTRNRSATPNTVDLLAINDVVHVPGSDPSISTPDGNWTVEPDRVLVVTVDLAVPALPLAPIAVQVGATSPDASRE
ncbi:MAG: hypothetical protein FJW94_06695 [Actinobacteria bacterium]|nr:hypothetical protein [Actinomycetota bacterium]